LEELTGIEIRDLSFAGADARSALLRQMPLVDGDDQDSWILLCIGGNDMLGRTTLEDFENDLDQLLAAARGGSEQPRTVLLLELPLIPGANSFGVIQRKLAARHGVILIPKRVLAGVILDQADVLDGVHLSPAGHERMARELVAWSGRP
jgi:acyl-CoA thioesterase-1